ncbi:protealysin inhibitor emfourin [Naumannella halotolerans]|uniref:protealysin inhibitor emfourin n=1 Tax=Naumannella halotolerans TaxID=993414 RepID=UPI00370D9090
MSIPMLLPPYLLESIAIRGSEQEARIAQETLRHDAALRAARAVGGARPGAAADAGTPGRANRVIHDARSTETLPGTQVRAEGEPATGDAATDEAYDGLGATWTLFFDAFGRDSLDGRGMQLLGTVHFGQNYANAFWDGQQMVFGDGDGERFNRFTASIDVIGHELTHGVIEFTAGLRYQGQSGALNESISDVFGSLVRQQSRAETAETADWLIGAELFTDLVQGDALRSMIAPGTAYDDPVLGKDPQPAHMDGFVHTTSDNGGVHINSGIPNKAFQLAATALGGNAWERAGQVWFNALTGGQLRPDCDFATFAQLTIDAATAIDAKTQAAVEQAWAAVGVAPGVAEVPATAPLAANTKLLLTRSGGFAGITKERDFELGELSGPDAEGWQRLVGGSELNDLSRVSEMHPDGFVYHVACDQVPLEVQLPEPALPTEVKELFQRTLG